MEHILSISYGKDSLACLGAIEQLGLPLDRIVTAEIWATETIQADLPPMVEFKEKADKIIKDRWGIDVEHYSCTSANGVRKSKVTYEDVFYRKKEKGTHPGEIYGFPKLMGGWCKKLKVNSLKFPDSISYLGIAADEAERIERHTKPGVRLPLVEIGWTEADCKRWCEENDLLSPIYANSNRGGCWFCHNQGLGQLRDLRHNYPDLWAILLRWDSDTTISFKPEGLSVHDYDRRFELEDQGCVPSDRRFRWRMLDENRTN